MIVYPAMDLIGGRVVRLQQGRFDEVTGYSALPADALRQFAAAGADWAHVVDLDGARAGASVQHDLLAELARSAPLRLQVAGGFRERTQLEKMFDAGANRVVIGSLAVRQPDLVARWIDEFGPERIALALDVKIIGKIPWVRISGWTESTGFSLWEIAARFSEARHLIVTDIGQDGMLKGPSLSLYDEIARNLPLMKVQASGGIASLEDLRKLRTDGAIVGRALWDGLVDIGEALAVARA